MRHFALNESSLLGCGGEARVYALDHERVVRIHRPGTNEAAIAARTKLLADMDTSGVGFRIPEVLDSVVIDGMRAVVETRLPGESMDKLLASGAPNRRKIIASYLDTSKRIADIRLDRDFFGDLLGNRPLRRADFGAYLREKAARRLAAAARDLAVLADGDFSFPVADGAPALVHLDYFPGNVLIDGGEVSAVIDFSEVSIMGDRRFDPVAAVAYFEPPITPDASPEDRRQALEWLAEEELMWLYPRVKRWLAAFWSPADDDDAALNRWCRSTLLG